MVRPSKLLRISTAGRMSRIFSADEDRLIIGKKAYGNFRICLEGQFKDAYFIRAIRSIRTEGLELNQEREDFTYVRVLKTQGSPAGGI